MVITFIKEGLTAVGIIIMVITITEAATSTGIIEHHKGPIVTRIDRAAKVTTATIIATGTNLGVVASIIIERGGQRYPSRDQGTP